MPATEGLTNNVKPFVTLAEYKAKRAHAHDPAVRRIALRRKMHSMGKRLAWVAPRPSEGGLVAAGEHRAALTREAASRWQWVREAWWKDRGVPRTPAPERYHWPAEFTLAQFKAVRLTKLEGQRW